MFKSNRIQSKQKIGVVVNHNGEPVQAINLCMCTNERCLSVTDNGLHNISSSFLIVFSGINYTELNSYLGSD